MNAMQVIEAATRRVQQFDGHLFKQLTVNRPLSQYEAIGMMKIVSKISPLVGNLLEIDITEGLVNEPTLGRLGTWKRQDPDFPDVLLDWPNPKKPGFEIKAWYPMSTEITGRFKDSQLAFADDLTHIVLFAWVPEHLIYGNPRILKLAVISGQAVAAARDNHYHNPPDYLVVEPLDTSSRTRNLQQRNTSGYKWQGGNVEEAMRIVESWGHDGAVYKPTLQYQLQLNELRSRFSYRSDTNYGKMDRVVAPGVEEFKAQVLGMEVEGRTISQWTKVFRSTNDRMVAAIMKEQFGITQWTSTE